MTWGRLSICFLVLAVTPRYVYVRVKQPCMNRRLPRCEHGLEMMMREKFMTDTEQHMTIREMCDAFDVTARTLRFYESKELLFPVRQGTRRWFTRKDRARLTLILRAKRFGFSLEDIRQLLDLYDPESQNVTQSLRAIEIGKERLADMISQRNALNEAIVELEEQLKWGEQMVDSVTQPKAAAS